MLHSLRFRIFLAMVAIPVTALIAVGIAMHYSAASTNDSVKFRIVRAPASRGTGLRTDPSQSPEPIQEVPVSVGQDAEPVLFASNTGEGYVIRAAPGFVAAYDQDQRQDISTLNQRLIVAVGVVSLIAAVAAFAISRRVVGPVESLTAAAKRLEAGDLEQRVPIRSSDEVGTLGHAFNAMAETLERNEALRKTMTSDIAHELRTPLNNVSGYLDAIADGVVAPDQAVIASLQEEAGLLTRLVDDLEQLSLADAGRQQLVMEEVALERVLNQAAALVAARATAKGVNLETRSDAALPVVAGDRGRLGQVIRNLLENAIIHTPAGGSIHANLHVDGDDVVLVVADTGPGVPQEHLPFIFERFYRADKSRARSTGGAGLGLAIVKQLVEAHGGSVTAANGNDGGAVFEVRLPATVTARRTSTGTIAGTALLAR